MNKKSPGEITDPLRDLELDWSYKGLSHRMLGKTTGELESLDCSLFDGDLLFPVAVLSEPTLRDNSAWMRKFLALTGADLAPHGKTTMAPDVFKIQVEDGAWAISAATIHHVRAYRRFGVDRIFLANQLTGKGSADWLVAELNADPGFEFYCLVDSQAGVDELVAAANRGQLMRPIKVLIEVGLEGGRCGVRNLAQGVELAKYIAQHPKQLALAGIETFEGVFQMTESGESRAQQMIDLVLETARECDALGLFGDEIILTAGGSAYFDLARASLNDPGLSQPVRVVIRSGCYLSHDSGMYHTLVERLVERDGQAAEISPPLRPALHVWAQVQSRPEDGLLICAMGKRDVGTDAHLPRLVHWVPQGQSCPSAAPKGHEVTGLNDQHTFVRCPPDSPLQVGDYVAFGISHPCTTFDRWRLIFKVDQQFRITGAVRTYF